MVPASTNFLSSCSASSCAAERWVVIELPAAIDIVIADTYTAAPVLLVNVTSIRPPYCPQTGIETKYPGRKKRYYEVSICWNLKVANSEGFPTLTPTSMNTELLLGSLF